MILAKKINNSFVRQIQWRKKQIQWIRRAEDALFIFSSILVRRKQNVKVATKPFRPNEKIQEKQPISTRQVSLEGND